MQAKLCVPVVKEQLKFYCSHLIYLMNQSHFERKEVLPSVYVMYTHIHSVNDQQFGIFRDFRLTIKK